MWKIAIIDDDFTLLKGMKSIIPWERLGAEWAGESMNGRKGLELIRSVRPDIVLTDIYMPVMNGLEMIEQIRAEGYDGQIIIISGYSDFQYARQALRLEVNDYLSKPVTVEEIEEVLGKAIRKLEENQMHKMEWHELQNKLSRYEPFVAAEWVQRIIFGHYGKADTREEDIPASKRHWLGKRHLALGIEIARTERLMSASLGDRNLFRFALSNIIQEILQEAGLSSDCMPLHSTNLAVVVHGNPEETEDRIYEKTREAAVRIMQMSKRLLNLDVRVGIGLLKNTLEQIHESVDEAFMLLSKYTRPKEPDSQAPLLAADLLHGERHRKIAPEWSVRLLPFYRKLAETMRFFKKEKARECVAELVEQLNEAGGAFPPAYFHMLASEIRTILLFSMTEANVTMSNRAMNALAAEAPENISSPEELEQWILAKIEEIDLQAQEALNENGRHKQAVDFMIDYIHENYAKDITIDELSSKVYLSRYYLNQIFKKATGETFTNYLIHVRMEQAKKLLLEGKYLIYEVAEMVGYKNIPYFSALFKKTHGVNPSELLRK